MTMNVSNLKVASTTDVKSLAGAIALQLRRTPSVTLTCVGAGAINQAIKSIAIARGYVITNGSDLSTYPSFTDIMMDGGHAVSGIVLRVQSVPSHGSL